MDGWVQVLVLKCEGQVIKKGGRGGEGVPIMVLSGGMLKEGLSIMELSFVGLWAWVRC